MSLESYGKYQLLKKLATGGMAQIWLARQQGLEGFEKLLVVKRILPHLAENDDFIKMFLDEARIAARLNHPNVVQIFDLGAQDDSYFIAMEYIHGEDVRRVWKRAEAEGKSVPIPLVCRIIMDACAGLDYAHKKLDQSGRALNIVHRDISPQNILVTFEGGVKVVDFGIAKAADQATVTKSGVLKGKYSYMSPEQASGKKIDARTDIFALGVVLYELLTGTRLFKRSNDIQTLNAVTECQVAPPSQVNARLPADLDPVVLKALAKNPEDRYQEAGHLQAALEDWLLQNKLPSGSGHLAAFMQEIYTDRLAREAEEGRILIEELDARNRSIDEESPRKATPVSKGGRPTSSLRAAGSQGERKSTSRSGGDAPDAEATMAQRGGRSGSGSASRRALEARGEGPAEVSGRTDVSKTIPGRGRLPLILGVGSLLVGVGVAAALWFSSAPAEVRLTSTPPGGEVRFDGKLLRDVTTPCRLPPRPAGRYEVVVTKAGFQDQRLWVEFPESGARTVDVVLQPEVLVEPPPPPDAGAPEPPDAGSPVLVQAPRVALLLKTQPGGARLAVNGRALGPAPQRLEVEPDAEVTVVAELAGYHDAQATFRAGAGPTLEKTLTLKKQKGPVAHNGTPPPPPPPRQFGTVRFVVKPWATVVCGGQELGDTPFEGKQLPAGEISCTFTNPDLGKKTQRVVVVANDTVKVTVNFP